MSIYYNLTYADWGSDPDENSPIYTTPLEYHAGGCYIKARRKEGNNWSTVTSVSFERSPTDYIAYYPFSGNTLDASGNGYNLTNYGATLTTDRDGNSDSAYEFVGTNNNKRMVAPIALLSAKVWSISLRYKFNSAAVSSYNRAIFSQYNYNTSPTGRCVMVINANTTVLNFYINATTPINYNFPMNIDTNWHSICITSDDSFLKIYQDGILLTTVTSVAISNIATIFGNYLNYLGTIVSSMDGKLDEIKIYNRAVTESEAITLTME